MDISHYAGVFVSHLVMSAKGLALAMLCGSALEWMFPGERHSLTSRVRGAVFWVAYIAFGIFSGKAAALTMNKLDLKPLFNVDLSQAPQSNSVIVWLLGLTILPFAATFVFDFFYYWFHRLQHAVPLLWKFHSVHHAIEELNAINNYHHVIEDMLRIPFLVIPMTLLINVTAPQTAVATFILSVLSQVTHSNTKLSYGPLRYFIVEPLYHRIHHSIEPRHWNKNFAFFFSFWDVLFRTSCFPTAGEFPKTGVPGRPEARTMRTYIIP